MVRRSCVIYKLLISDFFTYVLPSFHSLGVHNSWTVDSLILQTQDSGLGGLSSFSNLRDDPWVFLILIFLFEIFSNLSTKGKMSFNSNF